MKGDKPVTLSVGEPFTTTITVALFFALLILALPVILYELFDVHPACDEPPSSAAR